MDDIRYFDADNCDIDLSILDTFRQNEFGEISDDDFDNYRYSRIISVSDEMSHSFYDVYQGDDYFVVPRPLSSDDRNPTLYETPPFSPSPSNSRTLSRPLSRPSRPPLRLPPSDTVPSLLPSLLPLSPPFPTLPSSTIRANRSTSSSPSSLKVSLKSSKNWNSHRNLEDLCLKDPVCCLFVADQVLCNELIKRTHEKIHCGVDKT